VGYDRYEGEQAWYALSELYAVLRLYVNFFQPSMKLDSKKRHGAKVTKHYDKAKTPSQRLLISTQVSEEIKKKLQEQYEVLDPLHLLKELERLQNQFWSYAWKDCYAPPQSLKNTNLLKLDPTDPIYIACQEKVKKPEQKENQGESTPIRQCLSAQCL